MLRDNKRRLKLNIREKAPAHADTAANASATKAAAESAARQTHTAVDKAVTWCQTAVGKLPPACSEALVAALKTTTYVDIAEEELGRLEGAALGMEVEEEEDDVEEEEEEEEAEVVEVQEEGQGPGVLALTHQQGVADVRRWIMPSRSRLHMQARTQPGRRSP
eukprot:jgi/Tetstr1/422202/TSEL_013054.t1